jgi:hypothetical protein
VVIAPLDEQLAGGLDDSAARLGDVLLGLADFLGSGRDFFRDLSVFGVTVRQ